MIQAVFPHAEAASVPLIVDQTATFLWQGVEPPILAGDFNDWDTHRASGWEERAPGLWACQFDFLRDAYIEYAFFVRSDDEARVPDLLNPRTTPNGMGKINHYFYMPEATATPFAQRRRNVPRGRITRHKLESGWLLAGQGYDVTYREYHGGHNYPAWRDDLWRGLVTLYGTAV